MSPITNVSPQLTSLLEKTENEDEEDEESNSESGLHVPSLSDIFREGQYVRAVITALYAPGHTDIAGIGRTRDDAVRASKRVELSLYPEKVNAGVKKTDLIPGFVGLPLVFLDVSSLFHADLDGRSEKS